jgi:hypothetical protein
LLKAKQLHAAAAEDKFDTLNAYRQQIGTWDGRIKLQQQRTPR